MSKKYLGTEQMHEAVYVEEAASIARSLIHRESRGPGDTGNAMRRIEARYGVPYHVLWSLRYRTPKSIITSLYFRLQAAKEAEQRRQYQKLGHELGITEAISGPDDPAVVAAKAVVGADFQGET